MSFARQFTVWYANLELAVSEALSGPMTDGLKQAIKKSAKENVYDAYSGGGYRRGKIGDPVNLEAQVDGNTLTIRNVTQPQGGRASMTETSFVESGAAAFRQPFPRPFMNEGRDAYAQEKAEDDLANALRARGFEVV